MKTVVTLTRRMGEFDVFQRSSDGYFDANALLRQWNINNFPKRQMSKFLDLDNTKAFIKALAEDESHIAKNLVGENQLVINQKGKHTKHGKTPDKIWMHPVLFIKFAMWINPAFEVKVIRFVQDEMIRFRNDAGDAYKEMATAIASIVSRKEIPKCMEEIAKALNFVVFGKHRKDIRNDFGEEKKQKELWELEKKIADLITDEFIISYDGVINYLRKQYAKRYFPKVFK